MERQTITGSLSTSGRLSGNLSVGGGTTDYNELENKPTYNGHVIEGDMTNESLGIWQPFQLIEGQNINTGYRWIDGKSIYIRVHKVTTVFNLDTNWNDIGLTLNDADIILLGSLIRNENLGQISVNFNLVSNTKNVRVRSIATPAGTYNINNNSYVIIIFK